MQTCILTIAGSDSAAGAGIQADIKTAAACGCYAASALTCVTAQNTTEFVSAEAADVALIAQQIECVCRDLPIAAVKVGMLGNAEVVGVVADCLEALRAERPDLPIVLDPVLGATTQGNVQTAPEELVGALCRRLLPLATIVTPNLPEGIILAERTRAILSGRTTDESTASSLSPVASNKDKAHWLARILIAQGAQAVLVKGGHDLESACCIDRLFICADSDCAYVLQRPKGDDTFNVHVQVPVQDGQMRVPLTYERPRLEGEFHGTGCILSSAIACNLAKGASLPDAVAAAQRLMNACLEHASSLGHGSHVLDPIAAIEACEQ